MNHPTTAAGWRSYFEANADAVRPAPWDSERHLTEPEREAVAHSLATFQLGESGQGSFLMRAAQRAGDPDYLRAVELFVAEEQRHAFELGRFLDREGMPRLEAHWTNVVFRRVRKLLGLELCLMVLVTAEIIALVYYRALHRATGSPVLRTICAQILRDERAHVAFHMQRLSPVVRLVHPVFLEATAWVVAIGHRQCLRAGGYGASTFVREVRRCHTRARRASSGPGQGAVDVTRPAFR